MIRSKILLIAPILLGLLFTGAGNAQTAQKISIVQGTGQLICDGCPTAHASMFDPMVVLVTDAAGNPVPNATVTWTVITGPGGFTDTATNTDQTLTGSNSSSSAPLCDPSVSQIKIGVSCNSFFSENGTTLISPIVDQVRASIASGASVTFVLTQSPNPISNNGSVPAYAIAQAVSVISGATFSGQAGSVSSTPIQVQVLTNGATPVPNVSVRIIADPTYTPGPNVSCVTANGTQDPNADVGAVLTDATGVASCYLKFNGVVGTGGPLYVLVGGVPSAQNPVTVTSFGNGPVGFSQLGPFTIQITAASPGSIKPIGSTTQSANRGASVTLTAEVDSTTGSPLAGQTVNWSVSPTSAVTSQPGSTTTGSNGQASTTLTLSNSAVGSVTVTASSGGFSTSFTITVNVQITGLASVSGTGQSTPVNTNFGQPLIVQVSTSTGQLSGVPVQFTVTSGSATLNPANGATVTDTSGRAQVAVTAGATAGPVTITATSGGFSQSFNLTIIPPGPSITSSSIVNGAGFFPSSGNNFTALSPCGIATVIDGSPLPAASLPASPNLFAAPMQLPPAGISIAFGGTSTSTIVPAPILNVTTSGGEQLITFQVPCELTPNTYSLTVTVNGGSATLNGIPVRPAAPGIFDIPYSDGVRRAVLVRPDGSFVSLQNPARKGEILRMYITGAGPVQPALSTGALPTPGVDALATGQVIVGINNAGVRVVSTRAAPDLIGAYEVTFQVPTDAPTGNNVVLVVAVNALGNQTQFSQASALPIQ